MARNDIERQRAHFNSIADAYRRGRQEETHLKVKQLIWDEAKKGLKSFRNQKLKVLEPMCGFAEGKNILERYFSFDISYSGFDYSDAVINELKHSSSGSNIWQADVTTYEPEPEQYDIIILIGGLHHVPNDAENVVKTLARGLAPGGLFINLEPTYGNHLFKLVRDRIYKRNKIFDEQTERAFKVSELEQFFENAGLSKKRQYYPGLIAYVLFYNPYAFPFLNIGGKRAVDIVFRLDRLFMHNSLGRTLSFATLGIWSR